MNRGQYIVRRLALMIPVLFGITVVVFSLLQLIPGDPATTILGPHARPETVAALRHELGLDRPLWEQYLRYVRNVVTFDLGKSLKFKTSVGSLLPGRLEVTLALITYATALTIAISLPLGIVSALRRDGIFDQVTRAFLMVTLVMPAFWVGILFLTFFSIRLQLFPVAGYGDGWQEHLHHLFLPALTIALSIAPLIVRALRTSILEGAGLGLCAHRAGERAARAGGRQHPCPAQRAHPSGHVAGALGWLSDGRDGHRRERLQPAGCGQAPGRRHRRPRLPARAVDDARLRDPGHPRQSWHRRHLHLPRSASETLSGQR